MTKRIGAIVFIFACASVAWIFLGGTVVVRTDSKDGLLKEEVGQIWGGPQRESPPQFQTRTEKEVRVANDYDVEWKTVIGRNRYAPEQTRVNVSLSLEHRQKGLLWYATYDVAYEALYTLQNNSAEDKNFEMQYSFPDPSGVYDDFAITIDGDPDTNVLASAGKVTLKIPLQAGQSKIVGISYQSQGIDNWSYDLGDRVTQTKNFQLTLTTDFSEIDFPTQTMAPETKTETGEGWILHWNYDNLVSGLSIGVEIPQKTNPGPFVSRVSFFAPVSLFFFFFLIFMITTVRKIKMHPMHYFFLAAAFFSFHLLLAYLVDHLSVELSLFISSVVSIFLVVSYMRSVVGTRFALVEAGLSQFVFLVLFSCAFFLKGYTGLTITVCSIITLYIIMRLTARLDWDELFSSQTQRAKSLTSYGGN